MADASAPAPAPAPALRLLITCEHGGHEVPASYAAHFAGREALLATHRGWDAGALELGAEMARAAGAPFLASTTTRLLVDLNRSVGHRQLYSEATRALAPAQRVAILAQHYRPHRDAVEAEVAAVVGRGERLLHIASHSFTPTLAGIERRADVAWLYDPQRFGEAVFAERWRDALQRLRPDLRLRRNYPYEGKGDGLTALLRKRYTVQQYLGIELEVNQRFVEAGGAPWPALRADIVAALQAALRDERG